MLKIFMQKILITLHLVYCRHSMKQNQVDLDETFNETKSSRLRWRKISQNWNRFKIKNRINFNH